MNSIFIPEYSFVPEHTQNRKQSWKSDWYSNLLCIYLALNTLLIQKNALIEVKGDINNA